MSKFESLARLVIGFALLGVGGLSWIFSAMLVFPSQRARAWVSNLHGWILGGLLLKMTGSDVAVQHRERLVGPAIFVANHTSLIDVLLAAWLVPAFTISLGKREILRYPVVGQMFWLSGSVAVDRERAPATGASQTRAPPAIGASQTRAPATGASQTRAPASETSQTRAPASGASQTRASDASKAPKRSALHELAQRLLDRRLGVIMFPEGTRAADQSLGKFHVGFARLSQLTGLDVVPIAVHGASKAWPRKTLRLTPSNITVDVMERIPASTFAEGTDLEAAAQGVRAAMAVRLGQPWPEAKDVADSSVGGTPQMAPR